MGGLPVGRLISLVSIWVPYFNTHSCLQVLVRHGWAQYLYYFPRHMSIALSHHPYFNIMHGPHCAHVSPCQVQTLPALFIYLLRASRLSHSLYCFSILTFCIRGVAAKPCCLGLWTTICFLPSSTLSECPKSRNVIEDLVQSFFHQLLVYFWWLCWLIFLGHPVFSWDSSILSSALSMTFGHEVDQVRQLTVPLTAHAHNPACHPEHFPFAS